MTNKRTAYQKLIEAAKSSYPKNGLVWCDDCEEINLWTYWQGRGNLDAKIMLVGQDWGDPQDKSSAQVMDQIRRMNRHEAANYMDSNPSVTDRRLAGLFRLLGYDILKDSPQNKNLFFTNFVLGYRRGNISRNAQREWFLSDEPFFKGLVQIIRPEVILCLGRSTFEAVLHTFHFALRAQIKSYNRFITSPQNPVQITLKDGQTFFVFALAHCGALGTMNRNRGLPYNEDPLVYQKKDWLRISNFTAAGDN